MLTVQKWILTIIEKTISERYHKQVIHSNGNINNKCIMMIVTVLMNENYLYFINNTNNTDDVNKQRQF